jgi:hypothetical protein
MRTITPMDNNFTLFLSYKEIINNPSDLIADAYGIDASLSVLLPEINEEPDDKVIAGLVEKISLDAKVH